MRDKTRFLVAVLISISIFLIILVVSLYNHMKKTELQFNERKAKLIKENLDLKDRLESLKETVVQKKEALALLEEKRKAIEDQLSRFEEEKTVLSEEYKEQLLALKQENASLTSAIEELRKKSLAEHIEEVIRKEESENLKEFLAKVIYNMEIIEKGGNIELEPIVVTKEERTLQEEEITAVEAQEEPPPSLEKRGKVVSVDEKYSLVIFDLGRKDGVKRGEQCIILKDEEEIAAAEIISARYRVSAAFVYEVSYGYNINNIKEGDDVSIIE